MGIDLAKSAELIHGLETCLTSASPEDGMGFQRELYFRHVVENIQLGRLTQPVPDAEVPFMQGCI